MTDRAVPKHVLCVVDGTPASDAALVAALELASSAGARLTVAACTPAERQTHACRFAASKWDELMRERCAADLERAAEVIARLSGESNLVVIDGCGVRDIARAAEGRGCDAIVVATAHRRWSLFAHALRRHGNATVVAVDPRRAGAQLASSSPAVDHVVDGPAFRP